MKRNYVSSRGIAYHDSGAGRPVLLIHAFGCDGDMWGPQIEFLRQFELRVLVPDLRGFGESPGPAPGFSFAVIVEDMVGLLDDAGIRDVVAAGVSMGAATSVALAVEHPNRVAGLLIADNSLPDGRGRGIAAAARIRTLGVSGLADVYEPILFGEEFRRSDPDCIADWRRRLVVRDPEHLAAIVEPYHGRPDLRRYLSQIEVPAAVVFGSDDAAIPEGRRYDYAGLPGAERHTIKGAGHLSNLERPTEFNSILLGVVDRAFTGWRFRLKEHRYD